MLIFISPINEVDIRKECCKKALEKCIFHLFFSQSIKRKLILSSICIRFSCCHLKNKYQLFLLPMHMVRSIMENINNLLRKVHSKFSCEMLQA